MAALSASAAAGMARSRRMKARRIIIASQQEDVAGMYDPTRPVRQAKPQCAGLVEAVEQALAVERRQRGAERVGGGQPLGADRGEALDAPALEPAREARREHLKERARRRARAGEGGGGEPRVAQGLNPAREARRERLKERAGRRASAGERGEAGRRAADILRVTGKI